MHDELLINAQYTKLQGYIYKIDSLLQVHGNDLHGNKSDPLDELIFIILSAQTESYSYQPTFESLKKGYPDWEGILDASTETIVDIIKRGGLANKKANQIKHALEKIVHDNGTLSLRFLDSFSNEQAEKYLLTLPGVGIKTAKCILMYSFKKRGLSRRHSRLENLSPIRPYSRSSQTVPNTRKSSRKGDTSEAQKIYACQLIITWQKYMPDISAKM